MAVLSEQRYLECPYVRAKEYLAQSLAPAAEHGNSEPLRLRVTMRDLDLERDVLVRYGIGTDPMHFDEPWEVHWTPAHGGPYPDFDGTLTVRAGETYETSILELQGEYRPPGGAAGQAFDAVIGRRIASNTAQTLLKTIGDAMEKRYHDEEEAKQR